MVTFTHFFRPLVAIVYSRGYQSANQKTPRSKEVNKNIANTRTDSLMFVIFKRAKQKEIDDVFWKKLLRVSIVWLQWLTRRWMNVCSLPQSLSFYFSLKSDAIWTDIQSLITLVKKVLQYIAYSNDKIIFKTFSNYEFSWKRYHRV